MDVLEFWKVKQELRDEILNAIFIVSQNKAPYINKGTSREYEIPLTNPAVGHAAKEIENRRKKNKLAKRARRQNRSGKK